MSMTPEFGFSTSRRRRGSPRTSTADNALSAPVDDDYYYDDSGDEEHGKSKESRHHSTMTYAGACSLGKFFLNPCLCLATATRICCKDILGGSTAAASSKRRSRRPSPSNRRAFRKSLGRRHNPYLLSCLFLGAVYITVLRHDDSSSAPGVGRPRTDWQLDRLPVVLKLFDFSKVNDVGGWIYRSQPFAVIPPPDSEDDEDGDEPDYGGLTISSLVNAPESQFKRQINPTDFLVYHKERMQQLVEMDKHNVAIKYYHDDEIEFSNRTCRRTNWKSGYYPNCNSFHELDLSRSEGKSAEDVADYDSFYFGQGYYRDVWSLKTNSAGSMILKVLRFNHKFDHRMLRQVQRDALVMERLTSSQRIVDVYGHCATSVHVEPVAYEVEEYVVPGEGYMKQHELNDTLEVKPQNDYTATEKLEMALEMAESLTDLHGFKDGVIVHDDVQLCQWLRTRDGKLKLGDFNRAEVLDWNEEESSYCKYNNGKAFGNYRSPEEFAVKDIDEKIDIFSFGNNIYALLTGLWGFYEIDDDGVAQQKLIDGGLPFVDERYRSRSYAEKKLVEVMERCWEFDPSKRIDIFEVVSILRHAVLENARLQESGFEN